MTTPTTRAADDAALQDVAEFPRHMIDAWNRGDAAAFAAPFSDTADFIAFEGSHFAGPAQIAAFHQPLFDTALKGSRLHGGVKFVRLLRPDVAIMHASAGTTLPGRTEPSPSRDSMQLFVALRVDGRWQVEAMLNARKLTLEQQRLADAYYALRPAGQRKVLELIASLQAAGAAR